MKRRSFLKSGIGFTSAMGLEASIRSLAAPATSAVPPNSTDAPPPFKLGLVTYQLAQDWDIETIIKNCEATGFEGVELRTTHKHGVEPSLSKAQREEVRKRFERSAVRLVSLGTVCEFESPDAAVVERNIDVARQFCELARDVGCLGVKVRPNGFPQGISHDRTLEQIGCALARCGDIARENGVEIWLEVHGRGTQDPPNIRRIMEAASHPSVGICWNSNDTDVVNGSVKPSFELIGQWLRSCHINEIWRTLPPWGATPPNLSREQAEAGSPGWEKPYPWRELFALFRGVGYSRFTFAEIPPSPEPLRLMRYYRALWQYHAA